MKDAFKKVIKKLKMHESLRTEEQCMSFNLLFRRSSFEGILLSFTLDN